MLNQLYGLLGRLQKENKNKRRAIDGIINICDSDIEE